VKDSVVVNMGIVELVVIIVAKDVKVNLDDVTGTVREQRLRKKVPHLILLPIKYVVKM